MSERYGLVSRRSLLSMDALYFILADVRGGLGPFLAVYLASIHRWYPARIATLGALLTDRRILIFAVSVVLFHFANAAMLRLVDQKLTAH